MRVLTIFYLFIFFFYGRRLVIFKVKFQKFSQVFLVICAIYDQRFLVQILPVEIITVA